MVKIKEAYNFKNELEKNLVINFLYNLNKEKINKGLANITIEEKNIIVLRVVED